MADLETFRKKVRRYYRQTYHQDGKTKYTLHDLASLIPMHEDELGKRLNGYRDEKTGRVWQLTEENVLDIVLSLAELQALTWEQAVELLNLMDYPFDSSHWKTELQRYLLPQNLSLSSQSKKPTASQKEERYARLQTIIRTDPDGLLHTRLESFVGRQAELAEVRRLIKAILPTGGYIFITGQAGQAKTELHITSSLQIQAPTTR